MSKDEWLTIAAAGHRLGISERQTRRYAGQVPDTGKKTVSGTLLVNLSALSSVRESKSKHKAPETPDIGTSDAGQVPDKIKPDAGHTPDIVPDTSQSRIEAQREEILFLRGLVEQHQRSEAELRAALREALKAMPRELGQGKPIEAPISFQTAPDEGLPIEPPKVSQIALKREPRPLWKVVLGLR
jgi:hypothetical protein